MDVIEKVINGITGGRVLDVATHEGHFVQILTKNLRSYTQIIGIDTNEQAIKKAQDTNKNKQIQFLVMNAEQLDFVDKSFDTVSISASIHHLVYIQQVLSEMERVLKRKGNFFLAEMHRDGQTEAEFTSISLHHWVAAVDTALGSFHNHTLSRQELINYVTELGFTQIECYDIFDSASNPMEKTVVEQLDGLISRVIQYVETTTSYKELVRQGEELRQRLYKVGAQREPILVIKGKK